MVMRSARLVEVVAQAGKSHRHHARHHHTDGVVTMSTPTANFMNYAALALRYIMVMVSY